MPGKEATKRANSLRKQRKRREQLVSRRATKQTRKAAFKPPAITEADLLAFQLAHFGDDTCPEHWFINAQLALEYDPAQDIWEEEDDLGHYEDGVKRTLTDEQIEMFRHSELEQIARAERLWREEQGLDEEDDATYAQLGAVSPRSDASSNEDLVGLAKAAPVMKQKTVPVLSPAPAPAAVESRSATPTLPVPTFASTKRSNSSSSKQSGVSNTNKAGRRMKKQRKEEVPYEQRNKRKWEEHIATVEPVKGTWMYESKTKHRLLREMDDVKAESIEMDY